MPTIGPVVAIVGDVRRPAILELEQGGAALDVEQLIAAGGGALRPRGNRVLLSTFGEDGGEIISEVPGTFLLGDGDMVILKRGLDSETGGVFLAGHASVPGRQALSSRPTVGSLIGVEASMLGDDPYLLFGVLQTTDPSTKARRFFALNLLSILSGLEDFELRGGDTLIALGREDISFLGSEHVQRVIQGGALDITQNRRTLRGLPNQQSGSSIIGQPTSLDVIARLAGDASRLEERAEEIATDETAELLSPSRPSDVCSSVAELEKFVSDFGPQDFWARQSVPLNLRSHGSRWRWRLVSAGIRKPCRPPAFCT